eukprot:TRINITY_DN763_c0_g1_i1.p1 TRINITY_DN763_c0_g1~~TRINITY_DN763_c0_g1_i1.p1  ORF type:complete len:661 (+),score=163.62 TRINITY_DN763_c0_g1_i1:213-2195(+)
MRLTQLRSDARALLGAAWCGAARTERTHSAHAPPQVMHTESHHSDEARRQAPRSPAPTRVKRTSSRRRVRSRDSSHSTPRRERSSLLRRRRRRSPTPSSYESSDSYDSDSYSSASRSVSPRRARYSESASSCSRSRSPSRRRRRRVYSPRPPPPRYSRRRRSHTTRTPPPRRSRSSRVTRSPRRKRPRASGSAQHEMRARDARTIFVWQLAKRVSAEDVFDFFSDAGRVRDVRLVMDRYSSRHKSAGYVEFYEQRAVQRALNMSGIHLCGFPVAVRRIAPAAAAAAAAGGGAGGADDAHAHERRARARGYERGYDGGGSSGVRNGTSIGWSTRRPIRAVDAHGASVAQRAAASTGARQLVGIDELKRLLNPNNLPVSGVTGGAECAKGGAQGAVVANGAEMGGDVTGGADGARARVYVGSIAYHVSEAEVRSVFERYGAVESVQLQREANGRSKGFAFVQFAKVDDARRALESNGLVVGGKALTVALAAQGDWGSGGGGGGGAVVERVPLPLVDVGGEMDEGRDGGLAMNNAQRVMLMQQLSRGETMGNKLRGDVQKLASVARNTRSVVLCNMFDPANEERGFEKELLEEVRDECMRKYGKVLHLHVESESHGIVYLRFSAAHEAARAESDLNGRWFGGKKIVAAFVDDAQYAARFALAS